MFFSKKIIPNDWEKKWILGMAILALALQLPAQTGENPFELKHRIQKEEVVETVEKEEKVEEEKTGNPFDVIRVAPKEPTTVDAPTKIPPSPVVKKYEQGSDKNFRFGLIITMLVLLALGASLYRTRLFRSFRAFSNENVMRMLHREKGTVAYLPYYLLYLLFIFNAAVYVYLIMRYYGVSIASTDLQVFYFCLSGVALVFFLKHSAIRIIGAVFPIEKETSLYNMLITIFGIVLCVVLAGINLLIAYSPIKLVDFAVYLSFFLIGIVYLFRTFRGFAVASKFIGFHKFHFFIYLCTLEIAPVLILWKLISLKTGIQ